MESKQTCLVLLLLCNAVAFVSSNSYDNYLSRLTEKNKQLEDGFVQRNPRGRYVLDLLDSSDYTTGHPVLDDTAYESHIDDDQWRNFVRELAVARQMAGRENDTDYDWPHPGWRGLPSPRANDAVLTNSSPPSRRTEVLQQNMLWGEHKVSGGSGEIGQWLDYAVLGAGLQDEEGDEGHSVEAPSHEFKENNLPAYCDPPNPCPLGYDPDQLDSPCDRDFVYTVEANLDWIMSKLARGECTCDTEHMSSCPASNEDVSSFADRQGVRLSPIHNPYTRGKKRSRLVAKKSFHYTKPSQRHHYHGGNVLKHVVKKNGVFRTQQQIM